MSMNRGFSIIEMMIALGLSSLIMLGMIQGYRNAVNTLEKARTLLTLNRRVALLFNQIERDFTSSYVYDPERFMADEKAKEEALKQGKDGKKQPSKPQRSQREAKKGGKKEKKYYPNLQAEIHEDEAYRANGRKWEMIKSASFVCTTPLEVYGSLSPRPVRVGYELVFDKKESTPKAPVYTLYRKETYDQKNAGFKEKGEGAAVRKHVVANHIKACSFEYTAERKKKKSEEKKKRDDDVEPLKSFVWTEKEVTKLSQRPLPDTVTVHIELWNDNHTRSYPFDCLIPLFVKEVVGSGDAQRGTPQKGEAAKDEDKKDLDPGLRREDDTPPAAQHKEGA